MDPVQTLHDFTLTLLQDPSALAAFGQNPQAALAAAGLGDISAADVHEVVPLVLDYVPVDNAALGHLPQPGDLAGALSSGPQGAIEQLQALTASLGHPASGSAAFEGSASANGSASASGAPALPVVGELPGVPALPGLGELPGLGALPGAGELPGLGALPGAGELPGTGALPGLGSLPGVPAVPGAGELPGLGALPGAGDLPVVSDVAGVSPLPTVGELPGVGEAASALPNAGALPAVNELSGAGALHAVSDVADMVPAAPALPAVGELPGPGALQGPGTDAVPTLPVVGAVPGAGALSAIGSLPVVGNIAGAIPAVPALPGAGELPSVPAMPGAGEMPSVPAIPGVAAVPGLADAQNAAASVTALAQNPSGAVAFGNDLGNGLDSTAVALANGQAAASAGGVVSEVQHFGGVVQSAAPAGVGSLPGANAFDQAADHATEVGGGIAGHVSDAAGIVTDNVGSLSNTLSADGLNHAVNGVAQQAHSIMSHGDAERSEAVSETHAGTDAGVSAVHDTVSTLSDAAHQGLGIDLHAGAETSHGGGELHLSL
ncbi:IniB N-terminal domain-containing protein [Amycolatopsis benzoatilytica]|uniref:IniB N-terminal domain-containing protein n=1 Tax=Amycolatopsis benzoatilytica TaxID=346045 RepID=UPI00037A0D0E|nr:IniB N-terminal domain-containing protein [Amycolatopsis benzoatilytica]